MSHSKGMDPFPWDMYGRTDTDLLVQNFKSISIPYEELFSETTIGCTATKFVKIVMSFFGFVNPHPLYKCPDLFAVTIGWLLLDIGLFILFLYFTRK